jgi:hypothetical protein
MILAFYLQISFLHKNKILCDIYSSTFYYQIQRSCLNSSPCNGFVSISASISIDGKYEINIVLQM